MENERKCYLISKCPLTGRNCDPLCSWALWDRSNDTALCAIAKMAAAGTEYGVNVVWLPEREG